ncbi:MAG: hypothetical protein KGJ23_07605 [Euryarchaeota archaeon]|nr:hypothetical protein [Euryarchaeota archaeon]MDE1836464.1 hypothetical protein [Euryarchaeota archaeon]MDE1880631.1 hypothetical protein [Euryarchaeota archaeon]MDE2044212.1 hypothetical protein [Thermoplasmata archaeon]
MAGRGVPEASLLVRRVEPNLTAALLVRDQITKVSPPPAELTQVSVSRLVNPGRAYYELTHPLPEDLAAHQKRIAGSGAHDLLEEALAAGVQFTELWLHGEDAPGDPPLDRVTARLDACEMRPDGRLSPTEIKNVGTEKERPADEHLEQLGMYCALMGVEEGRVLAVHRDDVSGRSRLLVPWKVRYSDLALVRRAMAERRDLLTEAFEKKDASRLPACPWWFARCKYREAGICDCGRREKLVPVIARSADIERDPAYLELLQKRAAERSAERSEEDAAVRLTLGSFLTPRKVYFAARRPPETSPEPDGGGAAPPASPGPTEQERVEKSLARVNTRGVERQVFSAVRRAHGTRYEMRSVDRDGHSWKVPVVDGKPFLVRVRHVGRALGNSSRELTGNWGVPDDLRQLALRASLLGAGEARVYIWNWKLADSEMKLQVFDVRFEPPVLEETRSYLGALPQQLESALASSDHRGLPLCPRWMCPKCEFLSLCQPDAG